MMTPCNEEENKTVRRLINSKMNGDENDLTINMVCDEEKVATTSTPKSVEGNLLSLHQERIGTILTSYKNMLLGINGAEHDYICEDTGM